MKNNGFTLIELLGVVVLLGLVGVIMFTSFGGVIGTTKNKITEINEENLIEAGETLGVYVTTCELTDKDYELLLNLTGSDRNCSKAKEKLNTGINVGIDKLKQANLFIDNASICEGTINVKMDDNDKVNVTLLNDVTCRKA